ncbi:MAG: hypothetical protein WA104_04800 [Thermodesulfovibrionales bacterium]
MAEGLLRVALGEGVEEDMEVVGFNSESKKSWKIAHGLRVQSPPLDCCRLLGSLSAY